MNPFKDLDEHQLLAALRTEDAAKAFEVIYQKYWFKLFSWAFRQTQSKQLSEELVQIVFEKIWRNRHKAEIRNLGAYLAVSLRHSLYNAKRKEETAKKINNLQYFSGTANTTEHDVEAKFLSESLEKILHGLPTKTETIFRLSRYESKSAHEIARDMEISEKTVEYHISKALKILRIRLREYINIFF